MKKTNSRNRKAIAGNGVAKINSGVAKTNSVKEGGGGGAYVEALRILQKAANRCGMMVEEVADLLKVFRKLLDGNGLRKGTTLAEIYDKNADANGRMTLSAFKTAARNGMKIKMCDMNGVQLQALFDILDYDESDTIERDTFFKLLGCAPFVRKQLQEQLKMAAVGVGGENWEALFKKLTFRSKDGQLALADFITFSRKTLKIKESDVPDIDLKDIFNAVDVTKDGTISLEELLFFVSDGQSGDPVSPPQELHINSRGAYAEVSGGYLIAEDLFHGRHYWRHKARSMCLYNGQRGHWRIGTSDMDDEHSFIKSVKPHFLSGPPHELVGGWLQWDGAQWQKHDGITVLQSYTEEIKRTFTEADDDDSGTVTKEELLRLFDGTDLSDTDVDLLYMAMDKNGDGLVSRDEFFEWVMQSDGLHELQYADSAHAAVHSRATDEKSKELLQERGIAVDRSHFRVTLLWQCDVDLDLYVRTPGGDVFSHGKDVDGFNFDVDDRGEAAKYKDGWHIENITATRKLPPGRYKIVVRDFAQNQACEFDVIVNFSEFNRQVYSGSFSVDETEGKRVIVEFTVDDKGETTITSEVKYSF